MASGSVKANAVEVIEENNFYIVRYGKLVDLVYHASGGLTEAGKYVPKGIKPAYPIIIIGKANYNNADYWDWGFRIENTGLLTARSRNDNSAVAVTWTRFHVCFIAQ